VTTQLNGMPRILLVAVVVIAAAVALPSVAQGATIHQDGRTPHRLLLQDDTGQTNLVTVEGSRSVVIQDLVVPIEIDGVPTCMPLDPYTVSCSAVRQIELDLGIGTDVATIDTPHPLSIDGGPGNDRYNALATGAPSRVSYAGGIGLDTASYGRATTGVHVAVDLEAGDGRPGDDDRIFRDVENVFGSQFDDVLIGSYRTAQLSGLDGSDQITGGSAEELLSGGWGSDRIDARDGGPDTVDCGGQLFDKAAVDIGGEASVIRCAEVGS
jgi:Ca2+-binding RTX toxin-like protein